MAVRAKGGSSDDEPDWNKEMSIFQKRISRPNQLATLRELEGKVSLGKVLVCQESLAIISGLNADAPMGTKLSFVTGGTGVLLWHRSNNLAFAIILGGASMIGAGVGVQCKIKGVLQVVDEAKGPMTKKDYEFVQAPAGDDLFGKVFNFLGYERCLLPASQAPPTAAEVPEGGQDDGPATAAPGSPPLGLRKVKPLLNMEMDMGSKEQISECLLTGVKTLDILTPLGRGMSFLVVGPRGSGKTRLALDALLAQRSTDVRCIYASIGHTQQELASIVQHLQSGKALANTAIVSAAETATIGEQLATLYTACSIGERIRDDGGHALVILDTVKPLADAWECFISGLSGLGQEKALEGLIKDEEGRDVIMPSTDDNEKLVDYQGMLMSGAIAQRRGFFSTLFLRPAKLSRALGGGSMTLMHMVPGRCATGISKSIDMSKYHTLSEEQRAKIQIQLESTLQQELESMKDAPGEMKTEAVEDLLSIADGQMVLDQRSPSGCYVANPKLSITRVGTRAYHKAMVALAPQIRLDLAQADDARRFSLDGEDPVIKRYQAYATRIEAALLQDQLQPVMLEEQVVILLAVQRGFTNDICPSDIPNFLRGAIKYVWAGAFGAMQEIGSAKVLTAAAEKGIQGALTSYMKMWNSVAGI